MKKIIISLFSLVLVVTFAIVLGANFNKENDEHSYLRVHIRANSNEQIDQSVKYKVKEAIVDYLTPKIAAGSTFSEAYDILNANLSGIEQEANSVLRANGFNYVSHAYLNEEYFPTRSYGEYTLENGFYDALIVELGSGSGDNWWCVVYPPLCFIGSEGSDTNNISYKSKLVEIIQKFFR